MDALEGVWELIEGFPIAMSPSPMPEHQRVAAELRTELTIAIRKANCKNCKTYDPLDYKISEDTILVPGILVVCGEIKKKFLDFPPALVVEILSPATALKDRHIKYQYYQQQVIPYYLIVDIDNRKIDVFHLKNGEYQLQPPTLSYQFQLTNDCTITPELNNLFNQL
ncbi:MAG: Uma2 family endonuclease [Chitinophagaceae bacterium]